MSITQPFRVRKAVFGLAFFLLLTLLWNKPRAMLGNVETNSGFNHSESSPSSNEIADDDQIPHFPLADRIETTIPGHAVTSGFTMFDQLYMNNGIFYVVTSNASNFPEKKYILSRLAERVENDEEPTDKELQFITPESAETILGQHRIKIDGFSVILYDPVEYMGHYYHWWGEIILGFWRVYSKLHNPKLNKKLAAPARFLLPNVFDKKWHDRAGLSAPLMQAAFPASGIDSSAHWDDLISLGVTVVFERAMIVCRSAAHRDPLSGVFFKMIASTMGVDPPEYFWEPLRRTVVNNAVGYVPVLDPRGIVKAPAVAVSRLPVVTYISRQGTGRRLIPESHDGLVAALKGLEAEGVCEVHVEKMESMDLQHQLARISRSTIIVGVHGNGLTHQLWMPPSSHSTVFEIFYPNGFYFDYEILARNMGHRHYIVWNDTLITYPKGVYHDGVQSDDNFHSSIIPVHGPAIAETIRKRLAEPIIS